MTDEEEGTVKKEVEPSKENPEPKEGELEPKIAQPPPPVEPPEDQHIPPPQMSPPQRPPPVYYPPQAPPQPTYTWEMFPHMARDLMKPRENRGPVLKLIGVLLIINIAMMYPMSGVYMYYGISEDEDFGGNFTLEGKIVTENGTGIEGAQIEILGTSLSTVSDSSGSYEIRDAPTGIKKIRITTSGYKDETNIVLLHPDLGAQIDFQLTNGSGNLEFNNLWFFFTLALLSILFSIFTLFGAYYAFRGKRFAVTLTGCILAIFVFTPSLLFTFIPLLLIFGIFGFILSFSAMAMTITNRKGFAKMEFEEPTSTDQKLHPKIGPPEEDNPPVLEQK
jgi:hypothetical protein